MKLVINHCSWDNAFYRWDGSEEEFQLLKSKLFKIDKDLDNWFIQPLSSYVESIPKLEPLLQEMLDDVL